MAGRDDIFKPGTLFVIAFGIVAFAAGLVLVITQDGTTLKDKDGAHTYSRSAIGHKAFFDLIQSLDIPVVRARLAGGQEKERRPVEQRPSLIVVAEPATIESAQKARQRFGGLGTVLYVLPKRRSTATTSAGFSANVELLPRARVERILLGLGLNGEVVRHEQPDTWTTNTFAATPYIGSDIQLIRAKGITPLVAVGDEVLVGVTGSLFRRVFLSDPDVLANHGLDDAENALFAIELIQAFKESAESIMIDETVHGFKLPPSYWQEFLSFPLAAVTLAILCFSLVVGWLSLSRFGTPAQSTQILAAGKERLVSNTARLLGRSGHGGTVLDRYARHTLRGIAERYRVPVTRDVADQIEILGPCATSPEATRLLSVLDELFVKAKPGARPHRQRPLDAARCLHSLKQEMMREPG